jgi:hypothetical protein
VCVVCACVVNRERALNQLQAKTANANVEQQHEHSMQATLILEERSASEANNQNRSHEKKIPRKKGRGTRMQ